MTNKNLEWGESYIERRQSKNLVCPNINCSRNSIDYLRVDHSPIAVGVKFDGNKSIRPYIITCECPECSTKYWFHITEDEAKKLAKFHKSKLEG